LAESKFQILQAIAEFFSALGAEPFIFPAMGSHGGATADGQVAMLAQLGVTESLALKAILEWYVKLAQKLFFA
jgi:hypothetical protein